MALLNESSSLAIKKVSVPLHILNPEPSPHSATYSLNSLNHARAHHEDSQSATAQRGNCNLALDPRQTGTLLAGLLQDSHAPQLLEELGFELLAQRVRIWVQLGELVCELAKRTAERIVFAVVHWVLEEVSLADFMFAVVAVRLVVVEVDLPEKPARVLLLAIDLLWYRQALNILDGIGLRFLRAEF